MLNFKIFSGAGDRNVAWAGLFRVKGNNPSLWRASVERSQSSLKALNLRVLFESFAVCYGFKRSPLAPQCLYACV